MTRGSIKMVARHHTLDPNDPGDARRDPWGEQMKYSQGVAWICFGLIAIGIISALIRNVQSFIRSKGYHLPFYASLLALTRFVVYKPIIRSTSAKDSPSKLSKTLNIRLPALGATILISIFMAGITVWAFVVQPYYRTDRSYGSPPLAVRTGMMATGLIPFAYALGSKVNFIANVTGTSHEKLQVYHQWSGRFILFLSTVHTIPFLYQPLREGGPSYLHELFFSDHIYTTGTVAYAILFVLVFASFKVIRERFYELFVLSHIALAVAFLALMFIHVEGMLTAPRYLWGATALYGLSTFLRFARVLKSSSYLMISPCHVEALPLGLTRLTIKTSARWQPGQHMFVRLPGVDAWSSHPFTIISLSNEDVNNSDSVVVMLAKAHGGFTKKIYDRALKAQSEALTSSKEEKSSGLTMSAIVDGPYGRSASVAEYERVQVLAGGSGITFAVASLLDLAWKWKQGTAKTKSAELIWSVREEESIDWMRSQLEVVKALAPPGAFSITIHVTSDSLSTPQAGERRPETETNNSLRKRNMLSTADTSPSEDVTTSSSASSSSADIIERQTQFTPSGDGWIIHRGVRADVGRLVQSFAERSSLASSSKCDPCACPEDDGKEKDGSSSNVVDGLPASKLVNSLSSSTPGSSSDRIALVVCGPAGMAHDASVASASVQLKIARGKLTGVEEMFLLKEGFGW